jgi:hypothetical protein
MRCYKKHGNGNSANLVLHGIADTIGCCVLKGGFIARTSFAFAHEYD